MAALVQTKVCYNRLRHAACPVPRYLLSRVGIDLPARQFSVAIDVARGLEHGVDQRVLTGEGLVARPRDRVFEFFSVDPPGACAKSNFRRSCSASRGGGVELGLPRVRSQSTNRRRKPPRSDEAAASSATASSLSRHRRDVDLHAVHRPSSSSVANSSADSRPSPSASAKA